MKKIAITLLSLSLFACKTFETTSPTTTNFLATPVTEPAPAPVKPKYDPTGKEEFVIKHTGSFVYGFCRTKKFRSCSTLENHSYAGKKGYFVSKTPYVSDISKFYPVMLETGESFYLRTERKDGLYGIFSPIIKIPEEAKNFVPKEIYPGTGIMATGYHFGREPEYTLDTGNNVTVSNMKHIERIMSKVKRDKRNVFLALTKMEFSYDEMEGNTFIKPSQPRSKHQFYTYLGYNGTTLWKRIKVKYKDDNWLFVRSFKVASDDFRWESPSLRFKRDHSGGTVWEWIDTSVTPEFQRLLSAITKNNVATVRFNGAQYRRDFKLDQEMIDNLKHIEALDNLLKKSL